MLTLNSGLIKNKHQIQCQYYELEDKCIQIVENYCMESKENKEKFERFAINYQLFRPYFDFVVCVLGYKVINPQMEEGTILIGRNNHMYRYKTTEDISINKAFCYDLSDNVTLDIYPMTLDASTYRDCLVDGDANHILPKDMYGHVHILSQILNMILISNKDICEDYLKSETDLGMFVQRYYPLLRFQADREGRLMIVKSCHRTDNLTPRQQAFLEDLLANRYTYPFYLYDMCKGDAYDNARDISESLKYQPNKKTNDKSKILSKNKSSQPLDPK